LYGGYIDICMIDEPHHPGRPPDGVNYRSARAIDEEVRAYKPRHQENIPPKRSR
jgi:hypothetical protein